MSRALNNQKLTRTRKVAARQRKSTNVNSFLKKIILGGRRWFSALNGRFSNVSIIHGQETINDDYFVRVFLNILKYSLVALFIIICWIGYVKTQNYLAIDRRFAISGLKITGCSLISENTIRQLYFKFCLDKGISEKSNIFKFNIDAFYKYIMDKCDGLENLYVSRNFDYSIAVDVIERKPAGMVRTVSGKIKFIDSSMQLFEIPEKNKMDYIFLNIAGYEFDEKKSPVKNANVAQLLKISNDLPKDFRENVSEMRWVENYFIVYLKNGVTLYCHPDSYLGKIDILPLLYTEINYKIEDMEYFDFRFKQIYFKPKQHIRVEKSAGTRNRS